MVDGFLGYPSKGGRWLTAQDVPRLCAAGFRDINLNVVMPNGHVAEVQVQHAGITAFEDEHHSHEHYEVRRE